jgi:hypothetical protein
MNKNEPCLRCRSTKIFPSATVHGYQARIWAEVETKPDALIMRGTATRKLNARICGECGHVELVLEDARELWTMYQQNQQRS